MTAAIWVASSRVGASTRRERAPAAALTAGELAAEARHDGQREGEGLARAGLAAAEHVASGERVGQGVDLDGEGFGDAVRREGGDERCGHAERAEVEFSHGSFRCCSALTLSGLGGEPGIGRARSPEKDVNALAVINTD